MYIQWVYVCRFLPAFYPLHILEKTGPDFGKAAGNGRKFYIGTAGDIGTAELLIAAERYPPVIFFCHLALEKALKALYVEKYNDIPEKTHSLVLLIDLLDLDPPLHLLDSLIVINRLGITGRYPTI